MKSDGFLKYIFSVRDSMELHPTQLRFFLLENAHLGGDDLFGVKDIDHKCVRRKQFFQKTFIIFEFYPIFLNILGCDITKYV
jgi:hypothetical protein